MAKKKKKTEKQLKRAQRNREIQRMWESGVYTKADIARRVKLTLERVRQILMEMDHDEPMDTSDFDWDTIKEIRRIMKIPIGKSTHLLLENQKGIYKHNRKSKAAAEYLIYVFKEVEDRLDRLYPILDNMEWPGK